MGHSAGGRSLLRSFARVRLKPGETKIVRLSIARDTLRWRDPATHQWRLEPGSYRVMVGGASDRLIETCVEM